MDAIALRKRLILGFEKQACTWAICQDSSTLTVCTVFIKVVRKTAWVVVVPNCEHCRSFH